MAFNSYAPQRPRVLTREQIAAEVRASLVEELSLGEAYVASHAESVPVRDVCPSFADACAVVCDLEERLGLEMGDLDAEAVFEGALRDLIDAVQGLV